MAHYSDLDTPEEVFHCITCSDEALPATVISVDEEASLALVSVQSAEIEIDVSLVGSVTPGDVLLVHGGVALSHAGD